MLPEIRLRAAGVVPPIVLPRDPMEIPSRALEFGFGEAAKPAVPVASVPM